jgi:hypothetical protein
VSLTVTDASRFTSTHSLSVVIAESPITSVSTKRLTGHGAPISQATTVKLP